MEDSDQQSSEQWRYEVHPQLVGFHVLSQEDSADDTLSFSTWHLNEDSRIKVNASKRRTTMT